MNRTYMAEKNDQLFLVSSWLPTLQRMWWFHEVHQTLIILVVDFSSSALLDTDLHLYKGGSVQTSVHHILRKKLSSTMNAH